jgi:hypothetical protein
MKAAFDVLRTKPGFSELDLQRLYHTQYPQNAVLDGGIFHCNLNPYGTSGVTGSWTDPGQLKSLGYRTTRTASIISRDQYTVTKV